MQKAFPNSVVVPVHLDDVASFVGHIRTVNQSRMTVVDCLGGTRIVSKDFPFCRSSAD